MVNRLAPVDGFMYEGEWPAELPIEGNLKQLSHAAWAIKDAVGQVDFFHVNSAMARVFRICRYSVSCTMHTDDEEIARYYARLPEVNYVTISDFQRHKLPMPKMRTIHHGIDRNLYEVREKKDDYLAFLGRVAPAKGTHHAIEVAQKSGIPLKIAGEIQPFHQDYWESQIKPHVDGKFIEYVGQVNLKEKNELLGGARALVFPIQWDEPFGLVLIEAMACGTPVLATPRGSVPEIVKDGISGYVCSTVNDLVKRARNLQIPAATVRAYMEEFFSVERMTRDYIALYSEILRDGVAEAEQIVA